jgi:hypothetical protein
MGQGTGEADEVIDFVRLGFDEEIRFLGRITLGAETFGDLTFDHQAVNAELRALAGNAWMR